MNFSWFDAASKMISFFSDCQNSEFLLLSLTFQNKEKLFHECWKTILWETHALFFAETPLYCHLILNWPKPLQKRVIWYYTVYSKSKESQFQSQFQSFKLPVPIFLNPNSSVFIKRAKIPRHSNHSVSQFITIMCFIPEMPRVSANQIEAAESQSVNCRKWPSQTFKLCHFAIKLVCEIPRSFEP